MALKYIFFRVFKFYKQRWPNYDPEIYGFWAVLFVVTIWMLALYMTVSKMYADARIGKGIALVIYLIEAAMLYYFLMIRNNYETFAKDEFYKGTIFEGRFGTYFIWLSFIVPFIIIILIAAIKKTG